MEVPFTELTHPRITESTRVSQQVSNHFHNTINLLNNAVWGIDPAAALTKAQLRHVSRSVVEKAIGTLPLTQQTHAREVYDHIKLNQHMSYAVPPKTMAHKLSVIKAGKKIRVSLDYRFISIRGIAQLSSGGVCAFQSRPDDGGGTEDDTLIRVCWKSGDRYAANVSAQSAKVNSQHLALLAKDMGLRSQTTIYFCIVSGVDGGNNNNNNDNNMETVTGETAALLRSRGLDLRVVHVPGEPDPEIKRQQEIARRKSLLLSRSSSRLRRGGRGGRSSSGSGSRRSGGVKPPRNARQFFVQDAKLSLRSAKLAFQNLSTQEKRVYEDKAEADRRRFELEKAKSKPLTSYQIYCSDVTPVLLQQHPHKYEGLEGQATLDRDLKSQWMQLGSSAWLEYESKLDCQPMEKKTEDDKYLVDLLWNAVRADSDSTSRMVARSKKSLFKLDPATIEQAIATFHPTVRDRMRRAYEASSTKKREFHQYIAITGTTTLSSGETLHFLHPDNTTDNTADNTLLLRVRWHRGNQYHAEVSTVGVRRNYRNMALLAKDTGLFHALSPKRFLFAIKIIDGQVTGEKAVVLRSRGLDLRVVKRDDLRTERQPKPLLKRHNTVKPPLNARQIFMQDAKLSLQFAKGAFQKLTASERKVFEDRAEADRRRFDSEKAESKPHQVDPLIVDQAVATFHPTVRDRMRTAFEIHIKKRALHQLISITGVATLRSGERLHFVPDIHLRARWYRGNQFLLTISTKSVRTNYKNLALLAMDAGLFHALSPQRFSFSFSIVDGNVVGKNVNILQDRGLAVQACVH